jgi:hypothetical protein
VLAVLSPARLARPAEANLEDARESLAYWEHRAHTLPRHALRRRREARELADRWRERVAEAEREAYGAGLLGALLMLAAERRLPQPVRQAGRLAVRRATQAAAVVCVAIVAVLLTGAYALFELLAAFVRALG